MYMLTGGTNTRFNYNHSNNRENSVVKYSSETTKYIFAVSDGKELNVLKYVSAETQ